MLNLNFVLTKVVEQLVVYTILSAFIFIFIIFEDINLFLVDIKQFYFVVLIKNYLFLSILGLFLNFFYRKAVGNIIIYMILNAFVLILFIFEVIYIFYYRSHAVFLKSSKMDSSLTPSDTGQEHHSIAGPTKILGCKKYLVCPKCNDVFTEKELFMLDKNR